MIEKNAYLERTIGQISNMLMKKSVFLSLLAGVLLSANAGAQVFNHLSLGVGGGTDGLSFELAAPLGGHVQVRAGYGTALGLIGYTVQGVSVPENPVGASGTMTQVPMKINLGMSDARLLFNIYPGKGGFHFTLGVHAGAARYARGTLTGLPAVYNTVGLEMDGCLVKANNGEMQANLLAPGLGSGTFAVKPYVGIGFGRPVRADKRVSFSFDMGAQYQGKSGLWASGEGLTGQVKDVQFTEKDARDVVSAVDGITRYLAFWPTLNFHLYVRLF